MQIRRERERWREKIISRTKNRRKTKPKAKWMIELNNFFPEKQNQKKKN